ncbi:MAG: flagellar hook-basal body complex protein FliE [bacterium]|nr:flagellar hook-basal body complex protein FliE [bacterium]
MAIDTMLGSMLRTVGPTRKEWIPLAGEGEQAAVAFQQAYAEAEAANREFPGADLPGARQADPGTSATAALQGLGRPLSAFLDEVNGLQIQSDHLKQEFATGGDVELHDVMVAEEQASVAVELTMQLRNKMMEAYQEIMRMSV